MINLIALNLSGLFSDFLLLQWYIPLILFGLVNFDLMFSIVPVLAISARAKSKSNSSVHKLAKYQLGFSLAPPSSFSIVKKYVVFQARLYSTNSSEVPLKYMLMLRKISSKLSKRIKEKPGFYRWTNKTNGNTYVGSSVDLGNRFRQYFNLRAI